MATSLEDENVINEIIDRAKEIAESMWKDFPGSKEELYYFFLGYTASSYAFAFLIKHNRNASNYDINDIRKIFEKRNDEIWSIINSLPDH